MALELHVVKCSAHDPGQNGSREVCLFLIVGELPMLQCLSQSVDAGEIHAEAGCESALSVINMWEFEMRAFRVVLRFSCNIHVAVFQSVSEMSDQAIYHVLPIEGSGVKLQAMFHSFRPTCQSNKVWPRTWCVEIEIPQVSTYIPQ